MDPGTPIHLKRRDRTAVAFRVVGALSGFALIIWAFATSSWDSGWTKAAFVLITAGGVLSYHLLTSIAPCPNCRTAMINLRISDPDTDSKKRFKCKRCGTSAYLSEGFYWQGDFSG